MKTFVIDTGQGFAVNVDAQIVKELGSREETLNFILKNSGGEDVLIFGDDIILTSGWEDALERNKDKGDIIGFSMLYPQIDIVQDTGYDLVKIDEDITLNPQNRGKKKDEVKSFKARECDTVNGCALFIKKEVIQKLPRFSLEGKNRWGEFLYTYKAKKIGFKVSVLGHFLYHHGRGTKNNPNKLLSSESYTLEREMWGGIVKKHVDQNEVRINFKRVLSPEFKKFLLSQKKILFYGAGSVSEFVCSELKNNLDFGAIDFCSGLLEEEGKEFCGKKINYYKNVDFLKYDFVLITVLGKEKEIFDLIKDKIKNQKVYFVTQNLAGENIIFDLQNL